MVSEANSADSGLRTPDSGLPAGPDSGPRGSRVHHRWAALLGLVLVANAAVLALGLTQQMALYLGFAVATSSLLLALAGVSISIIFPPERSGEGVSREYTLLVSLESLSFVVSYGLVAYGGLSWQSLRGAHALTIVLGVALLAWLGLQLRLLFIAAREAVGDTMAAIQVVAGTLLGLLAWVGFNALAFRLFGSSGPGAAGAPGHSPGGRLLLNVLGLTPVAAVLAFVLTATFGPTAPSLALWARASTAYLATLPLLGAMVLVALILGLG